MNEELVGEALAPFKNQVVIATKFGWDIDPVERKPSGRVTSQPDVLRQVVDGRLHPLGVEMIDLYYQHRVDPDVPIEEVAGTVKDLIAAGKVKHSACQRQGPRPSADRTRSNPSRPFRASTPYGGGAPEKNVLATCGELSIGFVPFSPLGNGFLTGTITSATSFDANNDIRSDPAVAQIALAPRPEALDRPDPRYAEAAPTRGEPRRR